MFMNLLLLVLKLWSISIAGYGLIFTIWNSDRVDEQFKWYFIISGIFFIGILLNMFHNFYHDLFIVDIDLLASFIK